MTSFIGIIDSVRLVTRGSPLAADAAIGATVLQVVDTSDFDGELGGTVSLNGVVMSYTTVNEDVDPGTVTLSAPLADAAFAEDFVQVWDTVNGVASTETHAYVSSADDVDTGGTTDALVTLALVPLLPIGDRDDGAGEVAECAEIDGEWKLIDLPGVTPLLRGELVAPGSLPQLALGFALPGTGNHVYVSATDPGLTNTLVDGDWWVQTNAFDPTLNNISTWDDGTSTWNPFQFGTDAIAAGSIDANLIAANAVIAGAIAAGALDAQSINAGSLTAGSISSGNIGSSAIDSCVITNTQYVMMPDDVTGALLIFAVSGQSTFTVSTASSGTWVVPLGVTSVKVECRGGGGSGQGTTAGGFGGQAGGGGEYARENAYPVTPGASIPYTVGNRGTVTSGAPGGSGADTSFDSGGVIAHGGTGGGQPLQFSYAPGGTGSMNSIHFQGGRGHNAGGSFGTSGGGGGAGAGSAAAGANGGAPSGLLVGGVGGTGSFGGGSGGNGGDAGGTGQNGAAANDPGGGGGGAGAGSAARAGGAGGVGKLKLTFGGAIVLVASVSAVAGTAYGNSYAAGVRVYRPDLVNGVGGYSRTATFSVSGVTSSTAQTVIGAVTTAVEGGVTELFSDYGSGFTSGVFIAPAPGDYDMDIFATQGANNIGCTIQRSTNGGSSFTTIGEAFNSGRPAGNVSCHRTRYLNTGDQVRFGLYQTSGSNQTITGEVYVGRRG